MSASDYVVGSATSLFSVSGLRLRIWPIVGTIALGYAVLLSGDFAYLGMSKYLGAERSTSMPWLLLYVHHFAQLLTALLFIAWLSKGRFSDYGLRWPKDKSYVTAAVAWGIFSGLLMTVIDYFPQIMARTAPSSLPLTTMNLAGWLSFEGIFVGFAEEIPFRGLLQTFLMKRVSGRVRFLKFEMHIAGILLALFFALAHLATFREKPFWIALGQQGYAFALGILYAYWYEKSGSLLAPIVGHNLGDVLEYAFIFLMIWLWS